jgi:uncharacterized membrane protein YgdD (TMEM256/DUF423 family)
MISHKTFLLLGSINMLLAVMLGAFGSHGLKNKLEEKLFSAFSTGVEYHFYHALGLLAIGLLSQWVTDSSLLKASGWAMFAGLCLFSGSLYAMALTGNKLFGPVTPLGGLLFIVSWVLLSVAILKT